MEKRTNVRVTVYVNINDIVFDAYQEAEKRYPEMLKESYERAMVVRPDLPDRGSTGSWEVRVQSGEAVQAILEVDNYTVVCNILVQGTTYRMMGWYVHRNPKK